MPHDSSARTASPPRLRRWHRASAVVVGLFAVVHVLGHLAGLAGQPAHDAVLHALRTVYRQPLVEAALLAAVLFQATSGLALLWRGRGRRRGAVARLQALSGGYLALFLLVHVGAVLQARTQGLDTNLEFAAAGLHVPPWQWFFAPYYFLAVAALGAHIGCALHWSLPLRWRARALALCVAAGLALGAVLVGLLAGLWRPLEIAPQYLLPFAGSG